MKCCGVGLVGMKVEMCLGGKGREEGENLSLRLKEMNMNMGC